MRCQGKLPHPSCTTVHALTPILLARRRDAPADKHHSVVLHTHASTHTGPGPGRKVDSQHMHMVSRMKPQPGHHSRLRVCFQGRVRCALAAPMACRQGSTGCMRVGTTTQHRAGEEGRQHVLTVHFVFFSVQFLLPGFKEPPHTRAINWVTIDVAHSRNGRPCTGKQRARVPARQGEG